MSDCVLRDNAASSIAPHKNIVAELFVLLDRYSENLLEDVAYCCTDLHRDERQGRRWGSCGLRCSIVLLRE